MWNKRILFPKRKQKAQAAGSLDRKRGFGVGAKRKGTRACPGLYSSYLEACGYYVLMLMLSAILFFFSFFFSSPPTCFDDVIFALQVSLILLL